MVLGDSYCIFENSGSTKGRQWEKNFMHKKGQYHSTDNEYEKSLSRRTKGSKALY